MPNIPTLTDQQTLQKARTILQGHLPLEARGYKCHSEHLYDVLLGIAASGETLEAVCQDLTSVPSADTLRLYLNDQLSVKALPDLEQALNQALTAELPPRLLRKAQKIAIDFHDRPYYGSASQEEALWVRAKAKDGTTRFLRLATAYVIDRGLRLTVAVRFVLPDDQTVDVLKSLIGRINALKMSISCLLLDKGFASIETMHYLHEQQMPAIIACPIRGKKTPQPGGTRALCRGRKSYRTRYTFRNSETAFTAEVALCRVFTTARRTGRMARRATWLIFILIEVDLSPRTVRRLYRRRFGVETSYRLSGQVRGWTSSQNAAYRFVLLGLSFFMVNVWVHLCWLYTQVPRRGGRWLDRERFRLRRFARFVVRALEQKYGCPRQIIATAAPLP